MRSGGRADRVRPPDDDAPVANALIHDDVIGRREIGLALPRADCYVGSAMPPPDENAPEFNATGG